jgi:hypothetical protein
MIWKCHVLTKCKLRAKSEKIYIKVQDQSWKTYKENQWASNYSPDKENLTQDQDHLVNLKH